MAIAQSTCNQSIRPVTARFGTRGWEVGGCALEDLADRFGTPLYVIDAATVTAACQVFRDGLAAAYPGETEILYASKALCNIGINRFVDAQGLGTEVVSGGELATALAAGISPDRIAFQGNAKSQAEIDEGLRAGVGRFLVDNLDELDLLQARAACAGRRARILLRINPGVEAHTHEFIQTGHDNSKFGIRPGGALDFALARLVSCPDLEFVGLQVHIGSQIFDVAPFLEAARVALDLAAAVSRRGFAVRELDLGGGLGIAYVPSDDPPSVSELVATVGQAVAEGCKDRQLPLPRLIMEPGRAIVGTAGCTVYEVVARKIAHQRQYLLVDGGMADNPRPMLYGAAYSCDPVAGRPGNKGEASTTSTESRWTVAGKACEEGDVLIPEVTLPHLNPNSRLVVWTTGAYCFSMASNYNRLPRPAMVLVAEGQADIVRLRERYDDVLALDRAAQRTDGTRRPLDPAAP